MSQRLYVCGGVSRLAGGPIGKPSVKSAQYIYVLHRMRKTRSQSELVVRRVKDLNPQLSGYEPDALHIELTLQKIILMFIREFLLYEVHESASSVPSFSPDKFSALVTSNSELLHTL